MHSLIIAREFRWEVGQHTNPSSFEKTLAIVKKLHINGIKPEKVRAYEVYGRIERARRI